MSQATASRLTVNHPWGARIVQALGIALLRPWLRLCFRITVRRSRNLPPSPCLFACNHRSFADPPYMATWLAEPISFFARADLWKIPFIRQMLDFFHSIPVERENPGLSSMKGAIARLRSGVSVMVFPEGTRTRTGRLGKFRDGPALFSRRAGVPLVPVYLHRTDAIWPRGSLFPRLCGPKVEVCFGSPIIPPTGMDPREADVWVTRRLQAWMMIQERRLCGPVLGLD